MPQPSFSAAESSRPETATAVAFDTGAGAEGAWSGAIAASTLEHKAFSELIWSSGNATRFERSAESESRVTEHTLATRRERGSEARSRARISTRSVRDDCS